MVSEPVNQDGLTQSISGLYKIFAPYHLSHAFGDCSWLTSNMVQQIRAVPLARLTEDDLSIYANHVWSCGNENDFKYLLPRVLELFAQGKLDIEPDMMLGSLPHQAWADGEKRIVNEFLMELWTSLIGTFPFVYEPDEYLCGLAQVYPDLKVFFRIWDQSTTLPALRQLALLANQAAYCGSWLERPIQMQQLTDWLCSPTIIGKLKQAARDYADMPFAHEFSEAAKLIEQWNEDFSNGGE